jgi:hypothetical protein
MAQVKFAVAKAGSANAKKRNIGVHDCGGRIAGGVQTARLVRLGDHVAQSRFNDRAPTRFHRFDFTGAQIHTRDVIALVRKARGGDRSHVTQPKNANPAHSKCFPSWSMRRQGHALRMQHVCFRNVNNVSMSQRPTSPTQRTKDIKS